MLRTFSDWSTWFEDGHEVKAHEIKGSLTAYLIVMGWIISNADSEGGLMLDKNKDGTWGLWAVRETPLSHNEFKIALSDLVTTKMLTIKQYPLVEDAETARADLQVIFDGRLEIAA